MSNDVATTRNTDDPLAPVSARFALGCAGVPSGDEPPSGPTTRPFALRFAREPQHTSIPALPPHRYCPDQQIMVTDDAAALPVRAATTTTLVTKDGKGNPQEDWKPDLPMLDEP